MTAPDVQIPDDVILQYTRGAATGARGTESVAIPLWRPAPPTSRAWWSRCGWWRSSRPCRTWERAAAVEISWSMQRAGNGAHALVVEQRITLDPAPATPLYNQVLVSGTQQGVSDPIIPHPAPPATCACPASLTRSSPRTPWHWSAAATPWPPASPIAPRPTSGANCAAWSQPAHAQGHHHPRQRRRQLHHRHRRRRHHPAPARCPAQPGACRRWRVRARWRDRR